MSKVSIKNVYLEYRNFCNLYSSNLDTLLINKTKKAQLLFRKINHIFDFVYKIR